MDIEGIRKIFSGREPEPIGRYRWFAVNVPLVEKDGELCLLFETRSPKMKSDPGEICFPGGHLEPGETPEECALRETEEEIGIPREDLRVIGQGDTILSYANYTLYTFLTEIREQDLGMLKPQKQEVEEIFLLPLSHFTTCEKQFFYEDTVCVIEKDFPYDRLGIDGEHYSWRKGKWIVPIYYVDGREVWGITGQIVMDLLETISEGDR